MKHNKGLKIGIIVVAAVIVIAIFLMSPLFTVKKTASKGNKYYEGERINLILNEYSGQNYWSLLISNTPFSHIGHFFTLSPYNIEQRMKDDLSFIKDVRLSYSLNGTMTANITERTASLAIKNGEEYDLIDTEGYVIDRFKKEDIQGLDVMEIEGIETDGIEKGNKISKDSGENMSLAMKTIDLMEQVGLEGISRMNVTDPDEIWMYIEPSLSINLGDSKEIGVKLATLKEILASGYNGESDGVIDFTIGKKPIYHANKK